MPIYRYYFFMNDNKFNGANDSIFNIDIKENESNFSIYKGAGDSENDMDFDIGDSKISNTNTKV